MAPVSAVAGLATRLNHDEKLSTGQPVGLGPTQMPAVEVSGQADASDRVDVVVTDQLSKRYGEFEALASCSVRVRQGDVFGLLGPNGAGKTTLIRLLMGYLNPTGGRCEVEGIDPAIDSVGVRRLVSYLPGDARLPQHLRGDGVLKFFAEMHPSGDLDRSRAIADRFELNTKTRVAFMSTGMRQKLALSVVLGPATPLLILDEPTANLDPTVRASVLELVTEAREVGRTVVFSSHILSEIEETCDRVAFLRRGQLVHELEMKELFQRHRVTADAPELTIEVPAVHADRVRVRTTKASSARGAQVQIDTAGDLATLLPWLDSLQLKHMRMEPLGLRAVYDAVHDATELII